MSRQDLIPLDHSSALANSEEIRSLRRQEAEAHRYKTVWTKEPHGGEYRAVEAVRENRAFECEAGYDAVEVGPTTNFVGNHMTQAAIDLVQAELQTPFDGDLTPDLAKRREAQLQPVCVERTAASHRPKPLDRYIWHDCGDFVKLEISLELPIKQTECAFDSRSASISLEDANGQRYELQLSPLAANLKQGESHWFIRGNKLIVVLVKEENAPWDQLCRAQRSPAARPLRQTDASLQALRRQLLQRRSSEPRPEATQHVSQDEDDASPLEKVARSVLEIELTLVEKLTHEAVERMRLGDPCAALNAFRRALEEIKRLASERRPVSLEPNDESRHGAERSVSPERLFIISADLHYRMAQCRMETGQLKEAVRLCTSAIAELHTSRSGDGDLMAVVLLARAQSLEALEDYDGAHCDFRDVLKYSRNRQATDGVRRRMSIARLTSLSKFTRTYRFISTRPLNGVPARRVDSSTSAWLPATRLSALGLSSLIDSATLSPETTSTVVSESSDFPEFAQWCQNEDLMEKFVCCVTPCGGTCVASCEPGNALSVAVLLSGGVDSSVALSLLKAAGHQITAFYLKIWFQEDFENFWESCPWEEDLYYATQVCAQMEVPLEVIPLTKEYWERVASRTVAEIKAGLTPNPDVLCNTYVKFGAFAEFLEQNGRRFDRIASGHYARLVREGTSNGRHEIELRLSADSVKDQTYFLAQLSREQLSRCMFPLGSLRKAEVRQLAQIANLPTTQRKDSQGICFLGKVRFGDFVERHLGKWPGLILEDETRRPLGFHDGYWFHTIGQRTGLKMAGGPWYVTRKDIRWNVVYVSRVALSDRHETRLNSFRCRQIHWITEAPVVDAVLQCKVRHGEGLYHCHVARDHDFWQIRLDREDQGLASGQFAVFYKAGRCLGSGVIDSRAVIAVNVLRRCSTAQ